MDTSEKSAVDLNELYAVYTVEAVEFWYVIFL